VAEYATVLAAWYGLRHVAAGNRRGFARADHCDHIHWGMDA
jgi:hypothetical protein